MARHSAALSTTEQAPRNRRGPLRQSDRLSVVEAAEVAEVGLATMYRAVRSGVVPSKKKAGRITIERAIIEKVGPRLRRLGPAGMSERRAEEGERAAAIFAKLEAGIPFHDIVVTLKEPPDFVETMRAAWIKGHRLDADSVVARCTCGAPSDPRTARCGTCAPRSRVLTDAELAAVAGAPLGAEDVMCGACRKTVAANRSRHICEVCRGIAVVGAGASAIVRAGHLVVSVGDLEIATVPMATVRAMLPEPIVSDRTVHNEAPAAPPVAPAEDRLAAAKRSVAEAQAKLEEAIMKSERASHEEAE